MKNKVLVSSIVEGAILLAFGLIIAIAGAGTAIDLYFGILCLVGGLTCLAFFGYGFAKNTPASFRLVTLGSALLTVGIALFTDWLSFGALVNLMIFLLLGYGAGVVIFGIAAIVKHHTVEGIITLVIGAGIVTLTVLYLTVADFRSSFWLVVGILIAIYGAFIIVKGAVLGSKRA